MLKGGIGSLFLFFQEFLADFFPVLFQAVTGVGDIADEFIVNLRQFFDKNVMDLDFEDDILACQILCMIGLGKGQGQVKLIPDLVADQAFFE